MLRPGRLLTALVGVVVLVSLSACLDRGDFWVALSLAQPTLGVPTTLTVEIHSLIDADAATLFVDYDGPAGVTTGPYRVVNLRAGVPQTEQFPLTFTAEGNYQILVNLRTREGRSAGGSIGLHITRNGATINPTPAYGPGTPVPAATVSLPASQKPGTLFTSPVPVLTLGPDQVPPGAILPFEINLNFAAPVTANQPAKLSVEVTAHQRTGELIGGVSLGQNGTQLQVITTTLRALAPNEHPVWSPTIQLPAKDGTYSIGCDFTDNKSGATYNAVLYFAIDKGAIIVNPTPRPQNAGATIEFLGTPRATMTPPGTPAPVKP